MRNLVAVSAAALLISAGAATAAPAVVSVTVAPKFEKKGAEKYGVREIAMLTSDLRASVERELAKTGAYQDQRVELVLVDAIPNRPTFKQMSDKPGLSFTSFGIGGARIEGRAVAADGTITPLGYKWYETSIEDAWGRSTWQDAQWTFDRFARKLSGGQKMAAR